MATYIVNPEIEGYLDTLLPERESWLLEMEKMAEELNFPAVGPHVGMLLEVLARSINARRIMELGSGYGYSGLWFARALPPDGYLLLSDFDEEKKKVADEYFEKAGKNHIMEFRLGDAREWLERETEPYDLIFNDIDKEFYAQIIGPAHRLLRNGGLFITDNTLWHGRVTHQYPDQVTAAVLEFNARLKAHPGFRTTQLPLRDGISISVKIG